MFAATGVTTGDYLEGVRYTVIVERGTRVAALQAGQIDVAYPGETTLSIAEQLKKAVPGMVFTETASNVSENLLLNTRKPPFDNLKVRRALSFAIDRRTYTQTVHRGAAVIGASLAPKPWGVWGLLDRDLGQLPGYGGAAAGRAQAKALLAEAGFGPSNPLTKHVALAQGAWLGNYRAHRVLWLAPGVAFLGAACTWMLLRARRAGAAFISSCLAVSGTILTAGVALFPFLMPSSTHPDQGLTIWDASSSARTLFIMLCAVVVILPVVLAYTAWVFHVLKGRITLEEIRRHTGIY